MKRVLGNILLIVYSIIAITVTILLLSYNEYNCSELGGYTVFIVNDDSLEPDYKQGTILLIKETTDRNVQVGDEMFLYKVLNSQEYELVNRTLVEKVQQGRHVTYVVEDEENYASDYFIGKASDTIVIEGWGYVLGLLESKWGYLFCVVVVSLLLFLQEVFELTMEIKYGGKGKQSKEDEEYDEDEEEVRVARPQSSNGAKTRTTKAPTRRPSSTPKTGATRTTSSKAGAVKKQTTTKSTKTAPKTSTNAKTIKEEE